MISQTTSGEFSPPRDHLLARAPWDAHLSATDELSTRAYGRREPVALGAAVELQIASVRALSTTDFPGHRAAVLFCAGSSGPAGVGRDYSWSAIEYFLHRWSGTLSGVVFGGDEPTAHRDLATAIGHSRQLGFSVALQTRGSDPERLAEVLPLVDWVSLEVPLAGGLSRTGCWESLKRLLGAEVPLECRTFVRRGAHSLDQLLGLGRQLAAVGVRRYTVCLDAEDAGEGDGAMVGWERLASLFPEFSLQPAYA